MSPSLFDIPLELQTEILSNLDAVSIIRCAMTSKALHNCLKNSTILQYIVQLHLDGLKESGFLLNQSYSERLKTLLRRRRARLTLGWKECVTHKNKGGCDGYDLVGGLLACCTGSEVTISTLPAIGDARTVSIGTSQLSEFTIDPMQDLIVMLDSGIMEGDLRAFSIHIISISTNALHPQAPNSLRFTVSRDLSPSLTISNPCLQIMQNILMLSFYTEWERMRMPHLMIFDWKTSELVMRHSKTSFLPLRPPQPHFGLLSPTLCFAISVGDSGSIWLCELVRPASPDDALIHRATLHLPPLAAGVSICQITANGGPINPNPLPRQPFMLNEDDHLHVFTVTMAYLQEDAHGMHEHEKLNLFVHQRVFARYASLHTEPGDPPVDVPWEAWGPENTRIVYPACVGLSPDEWARYVHSQRVVTSRPVGHPSARPNVVQILDFSLAAILNAKGILPSLSVPSPEKEETQNGALLPSTPIDDWVPLFQDEIITRLPCVSFLRTLQQIYKSHMIYEAGIVGVVNNGTRFLEVQIYDSTT